MPVGMGHATVLVPGFMLLALVVACGDTPGSTATPTPHFEATVQARPKEERAMEATLEAKAQALAEAIIEATVRGSPDNHTYTSYVHAGRMASSPALRRPWYSDGH